MPAYEKTAAVRMRVQQQRG